MIVCYADPNKSNSLKLLEAFAVGAIARGEEAIVTTDMKKRDGHAVFYGVTPKSLDLFREYSKSEEDYYLIDNGYFNSKWSGGDYYRITKNRHQHTGIGESDGSRFAKLGLKIKPWRNVDSCEKVLLVCQSDWWHEWHWETVSDFVSKTTLAMPNVKEIIVRKKPSSRNFERASFDGMRAVVTHSSNVAIEALLEGVPVFCAHPCAAATMGLSNLSQVGLTPYNPDGREQWAAVLADNQWTLGEIESGLTWKMLNDKN